MENKEFIRLIKNLPSSGSFKYIDKKVPEYLKNNIHGIYDSFGNNNSPAARAITPSEQKIIDNATKAFLQAPKIYGVSAYVPMDEDYTSFYKFGYHAQDNKVISFQEFHNWIIKVVNYEKNNTKSENRVKQYQDFLDDINGVIPAIVVSPKISQEEFNKILEDAGGEMEISKLIELLKKKL